MPHFQIKHRFSGAVMGYRVQAGCRWLALDDAWAYWCVPGAERYGTDLGDETEDILTMFSRAVDRENAGR